jgi:hypothetical protein
MTRWLSGCLVLSALTLGAEPVLGIDGHWPIGTAALLGIGGSLLLALGAKVLGGAGLQQADPDDSGRDGA